MMAMSVLLLLAGAASGHTTVAPDVTEWHSPRIEIRDYRGETIVRGHVDGPVLQHPLSRSANVELRRHIMLPGWWRDVSLGLVELMDELHSGEVVLTRDTLSIRGAITGAHADEDPLAALRPRLPEGLRLDTRLTLLADEPTTACSALLVALTADNLRFRLGENKLSGEYRPRLRRIAEAMTNCPGYSLEVTGHTDGSGRAADNQLVSEMRAASVAGQLVELGVDRSRLRVEGRGATEPVASNGRGSGRRQNRRVELEIYSPGP